MSARDRFDDSAQRWDITGSNVRNNDLVCVCIHDQIGVVGDDDHLSLILGRPK